MNALMSKRKPPPDPEPSREPRKMVAIRSMFHDPAVKLAHRLGCKDLTELINLLLRERLERESLWPE